jgi:hypothetical protein
MWRGLVAAGLAARVALWIVSYGSNDIWWWEKYAGQIRDGGLLHEYVEVARFNHPPLMGLWAVLALAIADVIGQPGAFAHVFKLLPMAADFAAVPLLVDVVRRRSDDLTAWRAAAIFALSPVSIWVTAHHGNTDSACALLLFGAAALVARGDRPFLAGLAFAASLDVKLLPLACAPALFILQARDAKTALYFCAGGLVGAVPFAAPLIAVGHDFYEHAIAYNSFANRWGVHLVLDLASRVDAIAADANLVDQAWASAARWVIMAASFGLGVWGRRTGKSALEVTTLAIAVFLILAPGMATQYLVYPLLLLASVDLRRALLYSLVAGAFLTVVYLSYERSWIPLQTGHAPMFSVALGACGVPAWLALVELVCSRLFPRRLASAAHAVVSP